MNYEENRMMKMKMQKLNAQDIMKQQERNFQVSLKALFKEL